MTNDSGGGGRQAPVRLPLRRPPLRRDAERNRARVLEAARSLFAERGLSVSHDEIAHAAEVGVGTVYRRFPTKTDLLAALFEGQVDHLVERAEAARADADPWRGLCTFLTEIVDLQAADKGLQELLGGADPASAAELAGLARRRIGPVVADLLQRARHNRQIRDDLTVEDVALIPVMVGAVSDRTRGVAPGLHRRMLALILKGAERPPTSTDTPSEPLPGPALAPDQFHHILGGAPT